MALKIVKSLLSERDKIFVPLPKEQQITEESLIEFERQIAASSKKNDLVLIESLRYAEESDVCEAIVNEVEGPVLKKTLGNK